MYKIFCDDNLIYSPETGDCLITTGALTQGLNSSGSLVFTITKDHPMYGRINLMKSIVTLYEDDSLLFRGRPYSPTVDLFRNDTIECEGELAFLNDSIQEPFDYFGDVETLFTQMIETHNEQVDESRQFVVGNVTVTSSTQDGNIVRASEDYLTTWEFLSEKFIDTSLGGYINIRHENDVTYIDYLEDINVLGMQTVEQCVNLIDAEQTTVSEELATVIIPLGAIIEETDPPERLTIKEVNYGKIYIESQDGIDTYGRITKVVIHDDITNDINLLLAGQDDLSNAMGVLSSLSLTAADLSKAGYDVESFKLGTKIHVKIQNLNIDERLLVRELKLDLLHPESNSLTLGRIRKTLTEEQLETNRSLVTLKADIRNSIQKGLSNKIKTEIESRIEQTYNSILLTVSESYYNMGAVDTLIQQLSTQIEQTAEDITFVFNSFKTEQEAINDEQFEITEEWRKYIRFVGGNIEIGIVDNPMILRLENDRIVFLENGVEVSYWENRGFYAVDGEFLRSLQLGKFAFYPRESGNLSFYKNK